MSLLRYPLVAALLGLFLGTLASNSTGSESIDGAPAATESRDAKDSARRDESKSSPTADADACPSSAR